MFTGLIEATGELLDRAPALSSLSGDGQFRLKIATALAGELAPGDSVAVNGVCLTVVQSRADEISADIGPETVRVTTLGSLACGSRVNLERPLRPDGRLGGHFVQGHVDGVGAVRARRSEADCEWLTVGFPDALGPYLIPKGSIAVDGISLTIASLGTDRFDVMVIPYTLEHTNLGRIGVQDRVNLECDLVGKYVVRMMELRAVTR